MEAGLPHCKHRFHYKCILEWANNGENKCPLCKVVFREVVRIPDGHKERVRDRKQKESASGGLGDYFESDDDEDEEEEEDGAYAEQLSWRDTAYAMAADVRPKARLALAIALHQLGRHCS